MSKIMRRMFAVPIPHRNAARLYGQENVNVSFVTEGRKYFKDTCAGRLYDKEEKRNANGDIYYVEYCRNFSGEWMLFETMDAADRFLQREKMQKVIAKAHTDDMTYQQMQAICELIRTPPVPKEETKENGEITLSMLDNGFLKNIAGAELKEDELRCHIGDYWFCFGGNENTNPDNIPQYEKLKLIKDVLDEFRKDENTIDEYRYYYAILKEHGC